MKFAGRGANACLGRSQCNRSDERHDRALAARRTCAEGGVLLRFIRTVDTHVTRMRQKLARDDHHWWGVAVVRGVGYEFEVAQHGGLGWRGRPRAIDS